MWHRGFAQGSVFFRTTLPITRHVPMQTFFSTVQGITGGPADSPVSRNITTMGVPLFRHSSTAHIGARTAKRGSITTMLKITFAKGEPASRALTKTVPSMPSPRVPLSGVTSAMVDFTDPLVSRITWARRFVSASKHVPVVKPSIAWSKVNPIGAVMPKCPSCQTFQDIRTHRCFIQPVEDEPPEDSRPMEDPTEEPSDSQQAPALEPLFVYVDIEAMQMPDRTFQANLLCYRHSEDSAIHSLKGSYCCLQFLRDLDDPTEVPEDDRERSVIVIFHNLKRI